MSAAPARPVAVWSAFFTCTLIWGSTFLLIAIGNDALPPVWGAMWRLFLAAAILLAIAALRKQPLPTGRALKFAILYGTLSYGVNFPLLYWGELSVPTGVTALMYATLPLTTPLMATAAGLEKLQGLKLAGGAVAFAGVAMIFWRQIAGETDPLHLIAVLLAATIAGFATVVLKLGPRQAPVPLNGIASLVGAVICLAISFLAGEAHPIPTTAAQIVPVLYLAVLGSVGAFTLLAWLVNHWDPTNIAFISVVTPVIAVTLGAVVRHEQVGASLLFGAVLVMGGIAMAAASDRLARRKPAH